MLICIQEIWTGFHIKMMEAIEKEKEKKRKCIIK
jgi:hypothetical protein